MLPRIVSALLCSCLGASLLAAAGEFADESEYEFPIPGLSWEEGVDTIMHKLQHPYFHLLDVTGPERTGEGKRVIHVARGTVMLTTPADIELLFADDHLQRVRLVFAKAPAFANMVAWLTKRFGKPRERIEPTGPDEESRAAWQAKLCGHITRIELRHSKGKAEVRYLRLPEK